MLKDNTYIQSEADDLLKGTLRNLFSERDCLLGENETSQKFEKGIDYFFEVFNGNREHVLLFLNQNKGTNGKIKIIKTKGDENYGKISYQLDDLRHADYFYHQLDLPLIFTLCDINNKKIFWYDIQNDHSLQDRILEQKSKKSKSIQLYISPENVLNDKTFDRLLNQINYSKYTQIRKKESHTKHIEADYSKMVENIKDKHIIDKIIHTINLFEGLIVLPTYVICQLYPFKGTEERTYISEYNLYTNNEEFFDFISAISLTQGELQASNNLIFVENQKEKLTNIVKFLQANYILHIRWSGKSPKNQICLHNLFLYTKCDCERCNFERLNYVKTKELLKKDGETSNYETLRKGYTYYLMGEYVQSAKIFLKIYNNSNKVSNPINYTISTYNLIKLKKLIEFSYYNSDKNDVIKDLELVKFNNGDEQFVKEHAPYFIDVYRNIKEGMFYDNYRHSIEKFAIEIQKISFQDKLGSWHSKYRHHDLESAYQRFNAYLKHNFIIFNQYSEYEVLSKKILECFFALFSLKNQNVQTEKKFDWIVLELWIFNVDKDYSKYLIQKYDIKNINTYDQLDILNKLNELLDNLADSRECLKELTGMFKPVKPQNVLSNLLSITHLLNITFEKKKKIIFKILDFCNNENSIHILPDNELINIVCESKYILSKKELKIILDVLLLDDKWRNGFGSVVNRYVEKCNEFEIIEFIQKTLNVKSLDEINFGDDTTYLNYLFYAFTLLGDSSKKILKFSIENYLSKQFVFRLYDSAIIFELIDFDIVNFKKFTDLVPDMSKIEDDNFLYGDYENIKLSQVINIAYKFDLKFDNDLKLLCNKAHKNWKDYYLWLMDIDGFNYSEFKHYWILEFGTIHYYNRFKKSERLKAEIVKALNNDYVEGVAKIYFEHIA